MKNRIWRRIVLTGMALSLSGYAQNTNTTILYGENITGGRMEESTRTFPESPEWTANWGNMDGMKPPYIRLSAMSDKKADWTGALVLNGLPMEVNGGSLNMKIRSTQGANFGLWVSGDFGVGSVNFFSVTPNKTENISVPLEKLSGKSTARIEKIWVGLFNVPAYQYTTLFLDDISMTSAEQNTASVMTVSEGSWSDYPFESVSVNSPARRSRFVSSQAAEATAAFDEERRTELKARGVSEFLLKESDHLQLERRLAKDEISPKESKESWFANTLLVNRGRVKDGLVANPKHLFKEGEALAAASDYQLVPLLVADLSYDYQVCEDTACGNWRIEKGRLLQAGIPTSVLYGSKFQMVYDPYFVTSNGVNAPSAEVCVMEKCENLPVGGKIDMELAGSGIQKIMVNLRSGNSTVKQNLFVEVK